MLLNCFLMPLEIPFTHSSVGSHRPIVGCNACKHHITGFAVLQDHIGVHGFGKTSVVDNRQKHTVLLRSFFLRALDLQIFARLRPVHYFSFGIAAKALNSPNLTNHIDHTSLSTVSFTSNFFIYPKGHQIRRLVPGFHAHIFGFEAMQLSAEGRALRGTILETAKTA